MLRDEAAGGEFEDEPAIALLLPSRDPRGHLGDRADELHDEQASR